MSDIWKDAPEGAEYYSEACSYYFRIMMGVIYVYIHDSWESTRHGCIKDNWIHKPIYTQAMADTGELPSVGMECQTSTGIVTILLPFKNGFSCVMIDDEYCIIYRAACKPLDTRTDSEKALDSMMDSFADHSLIKGRMKRLIERIKNNEVHGVTYTGDK